jgi:hypothetical protein
MRKEALPILRREDLLVPPFLTGSCQWTQGYFETVRHEAIDASDVLLVHCFKWGSTYFDSHGQELGQPIEPVGVYALQTQFGIARRVCTALEARGVRPEAVPAVAPAESDREPGDDEDAETEPGEQSVVAYLESSNEERADAPQDLMELEEWLSTALAEGGAGYVDGHELEIGGNHLILYLYGPDADRLFEAARPVLKRWPYKRGYAVKCYGPPGAREVRVEL